jgi:hypothetical protein
MTSAWRRPALHAALLLIVLVLLAAGLGLLGGLVFLPQLGAVGWVAIGGVLFLGLQLLLFRAFGLRSRADEEGPEGAPSHDAPDDDWRAWRG